MKPVWLAKVTTFLALGAVTASAQQTTSGLMLAYVEGAVFVDGQRVDPPASHVPMKENSVVRTEDGRAEILMADGALFLGEKTSTRVIDNRPYNFSRVEMISGSAVLIMDQIGGLLVCEDTVKLSGSGI